MRFWARGLSTLRLDRARDAFQCSALGRAGLGRAALTPPVPNRAGPRPGLPTCSPDLRTSPSDGCPAEGAAPDAALGTARMLRAGRLTPDLNPRLVTLFGLRPDAVADPGVDRVAEPLAARVAERWAGRDLVIALGLSSLVPSSRAGRELFEQKWLGLSPHFGGCVDGRASRSRPAKQGAQRAATG